MIKRDTKKIVKIILLGGLFIFIILYSLWSSKYLLFGVKIKNVEISILREDKPNTRKITGNAKNAKILVLNGREISIDQAGNFDETISLLLGYNIITLKAEDKFGYTDEKNYQLIGK